jgi:arylsulfatase A-like enzyme
LGTGLVSGAAAQPPRPNVIFFFDDQLRAQAVGYNGGTNVATPNIDRLASQGVTFTNGLSTCPLCTPYRGMVLTGRYPTHTGLVLNWVESNPGELSIAEAFQAAGYDTGFIGKWHLAAGARKRAGKHSMTKADEDRIRQGTAAYLKENPEPEFVPPGPQRQGYDFWAAYNFHSNFTHAYYYRDTSQRLIMDGYETDAETDMAIAFLRERANSPRPFLLAVAPHPPHPPWRPDMCPPDYLDRIKPQLSWRANVPTGKFPDQTGPRCYYAMIANVDHNVGRLMQFLDESGLADNTIVVFTSDHGEMLGSHDRMNKMVPYAEAVDIPLIIRWPGHVPAGHKPDALYTPMDHMPTLLSLCGAEAPGTVDGTDLSAVALGRRGRQRDAVLMADYVSHWDYFDTGTNWPEWRAVRTRTHTYAKWLAEGREELYHNLDDPCQMTNLAEGQQDLPVLRRLRARLTDLLADAHDEFLPGTAYADWYDDERNLQRTALGPV